jgi:hypothetical protein
MGTWSSGIGKFVKKDPNHGCLWKKIKNWWCSAGLCNLNKCKRKIHKKANIPNNCKNPKCVCKGDDDDAIRQFEKRFLDKS